MGLPQSASFLKANMSELLKINVNDHTEKKGGLTYLSWAWAWAEVLKYDPDAEWDAVEYPNPDGTLSPCMWVGDTAIVKTAVTIKGKTKKCQLAVMDNRNNAVKNPDARKISDATMRCMTKAIAMHGLGLYIYAGEDLPQTDAEPEPEREERNANGTAKGPKHKPTDGAGDGMAPERKSAMEDMVSYMVECHRDGRDMDAIAIWYDSSSFQDNDERVYAWSLMGAESKLRGVIKANKPA